YRKRVVKANLYNAWLIFCLEWLSKACSSTGVSDSKKRSFFSELSFIFGAHAELVDKDMIFAKERCLLNPFLRNDYYSF
ncbi:glycosyltransferase family 2 protein, partial [Escherichia marmotae]|nr:glycosyltransferase family 2 protein [Escherichia marmotae]